MVTTSSQSVGISKKDAAEQWGPFRPRVEEDKPLGELPNHERSSPFLAVLLLLTGEARRKWGVKRGDGTPRCGHLGVFFCLETGTSVTFL